MQLRGEMVWEGHGDGSRLWGACCLSSSGGRARSSSVSDRKRGGVTWCLDAVCAAGAAAGPLGLSPHVRPGLGSLSPLAAAKPPVQVCPAPEAFMRPGQVPGLHPTPRTVNGSLAFEPGDVLSGGRGGQCVRRRAGEETLHEKGAKRGNRGTRSPLLFLFYPCTFRETVQRSGSAPEPRGRGAGPGRVQFLNQEAKFGGFHVPAWANLF